MSLGKDTVPTNAYGLIGKKGIVVTDITSPDGIGQVRVGKEVWSAIAENALSIPKDTEIEIQKIDGVKLVVTPVKNLVNI